MKRTIFLILCMMSITMPMMAVSTAKCLLQHKGSGKVYDASDIETALKNAVDGDTIFLTEGTYPGFTVNKKITVRGSGQQTKVTGNISISIPGTPTLTQTVLEGFMAKDVTLDAPMNGLKIKQCKIDNLKTNANNDDVVIDRCNISLDLRFSTFIKGMTLNNSYVCIGRNTSSTDCPINFIHCYVLAYYVDKCTGTFINCIVNGNDRYSTKSYYYCNFVNSLLCGSYRSCDSSTCYLQNCYENSETTWSKNTLENKGYLGNDNTVVGYYGGVTPYTLVLAVPKVTESTIVLDSEKKTLNVSLKVTAN